MPPLPSRVRGPAAPAPPTPAPEVPGMVKAGSNVWDRIGWLQLFNQAVELGRDALPGFNHSIQVAVIGGPLADMRRVWYLCVSAAMGRFRNRVRTFGTAVAMDAEWDITNKAVRLEINYWANAIAGLSGALNDPGSCGSAFLARGPEQLTIGGAWTRVFNPAFPGDPVPAGELVTLASRPKWLEYLVSSVNPCIPGNETIHVTPITDYGANDNIINVLKELPAGKVGRIPVPRGGGVTVPIARVSEYPIQVTGARWNPQTLGSLAVFPAPNTLPKRLPDEGRVITTPEKNDRRVQSPKPPYDGHSRCSLLALVAAALGTPCFLPTAPPCTYNSAGSSGLFVTEPRYVSDANPASLVALWNGRDNFPGVYPFGGDDFRPDFGPDGYRLPNDGNTVNYAK